LYFIDFDIAFIQIEGWRIGMDEIEVIRTIEELRKFLNDKNFMEIVVRQDEFMKINNILSGIRNKDICPEINLYKTLYEC
jgi:hypothetical protein